MDIALSILGVILVALLLAASLTFGFALIALFVTIAVVTAFLIAGREWLRRWLFVRQHGEAPKQQERIVIEGEYLDITHDDKKERL